jgi:hypothetical protein
LEENFILNLLDELGEHFAELDSDLREGVSRKSLNQLDDISLTLLRDVGEDERDELGPTNP